MKNKVVVYLVLDGRNITVILSNPKSASFFLAPLTTRGIDGGADQVS